MMSYLLSLPRASWKARVGAALVAAVLICGILQQWPHRNDDLAIARWMSWIVMAIAIRPLWLALIVCLAGRLPKVKRRGSSNRSFSQIRADIAEELRQQRDRSRHL
jgi:hypothetical protein